jgi:hypothetical protein
MGHRLPTILGKAIDDVIRTLNEQSGEDEIVDLVGCIERMNVLMAELSESVVLRPIIDGMSNLIVALQLERLNRGDQTTRRMLHYGIKRSRDISKVTHRRIAPGNADSPVIGRTFMTAPWVFAEAYKYRRLRECFSVSKFWKDYDVFFRQKVRNMSLAHLL